MFTVTVSSTFYPKCSTTEDYCELEADIFEIYWILELESDDTSDAKCEIYKATVSSVFDYKGWLRMGS